MSDAEKLVLADKIISEAYKTAKWVVDNQYIRLANIRSQIEDDYQLLKEWKNVIS